MGIVDADAHYYERIGDLIEYLEPDDPWRTRFANTRVENLFPRSTLDQRLFGRIHRDDMPISGDTATPEEVPAIMDHLGVDKTILLSQKALSFSRLQYDDDRPVKLANAHVDYMLDKVVDPSAGIYTAVLAPHQQPDAAVELIDRVAGEAGIVGVFIITAGPEPPLGHDRYNPIYEAAQRAGLPIIFHAGGPNLEHFHSRGYKNLLETHSLAFPWHNMAQLTSLVIQGVPEKFPNLDVVFQESGIFWVPMVMNRLDTEYMKRQSEAPLLTKRPSTYMKEFYYGTQPLELPTDEQHLAQIIDMLGGPDRLIYASDYPHWDYDPPEIILNLSILSKDEKERVLGTNAEEVFGI